MGTTSAAVTSGTPDDGDLGVVGIAQRGGVFCTGSLVAPRVVLTAAHCALAVDRAELGALFGSGALVAVREAVVHPAYGLGDSVVGNDLALLLLSEDGPATPVPIVDGPDGLASGAELRIVGFGLTSPHDSEPPRRRSGLARVAGVAATTFDLEPDPSQPCNGDSGGPAFSAAMLVGLTSYGDRACAGGGVATRVAPYLEDFIRPYLDATTSFSAKTGARCRYPENCESGACVPADDAVSYCSVSCATGADCPRPMTCEKGQCRYASGAPGTQGSACLHDVDCAGGLCVRGACTKRCFPDDTLSACSAGFACVHTDDAVAGFVCERTQDGSHDDGCGSGSGAPAFVAFFGARFLRRRR